MSQFSNHFGVGGLNDKLDSETYAAELGLDENELTWRKNFVGFDAEDAERLKGFQSDFSDAADELANRFYDHLVDNEQTAAVIGRSSKNVEQLKMTQKAYLMTLAGGEYNTEYFRNRARIGKLHEMLDMPIKQYLGQYSVYHRLFLEILSDRTYDRLESAVDSALKKESDTAENGSEVNVTTIDRDEFALVAEIVGES